MPSLDIFVLMPFEDPFHLVYHHLIKMPLEAEGHRVSRSLEADQQNGLRAIIEGIQQASVVVADLSGQNANVAYELGIAHALTKPTLQIVQTLADVRYDLLPYKVILYSINTDGTSTLASDMLGYIDRRPGNEFRFANPVNDFLGAASARSIIITEPSDQDGASQLTLIDDNEPDKLAGSVYGILDANADVERAGALIVSTLQGLTTDMEDIGDKTRAHTHRINEISSNPSEKRRQSKALRVMQQFALDVTDFSQKVKEKSPTLKEAWMTLEQSMEYVLSASNIENESDFDAVQNLLRQSAQMQESSPNAIASIERFRDSHTDLIGISRMSNSALRDSVKELDRLIDELKRGGSVVTRIYELATAKLEGYNETRPEDYSNPVP